MCHGSSRCVQSSLGVALQKLEELERVLTPHAIQRSCRRHRLPGSGQKIRLRNKAIHTVNLALHCRPDGLCPGGLFVGCVSAMLRKMLLQRVDPRFIFYSETACHFSAQRRQFCGRGGDQVFLVSSFFFGGGGGCMY